MRARRHRGKALWAVVLLAIAAQRLEVQAVPVHGRVLARGGGPIAGADV